MALIVVGGQTKNVGKTTLICNIIAAFPKVKWTAVKFSNHAHTPRHCEMRRGGTGWSIWQQSPTKDLNDTARFLESGADRSLLVQAENHSLMDACSSLLQEISPATDVIVESASAAEFLHPDLLLVLLDAAQGDFKESATQQLDHAHAFVIRKADSGVARRIDAAPEVPVFTAFPGQIDPGLVSLLEAKLGRHA